MIGNKNATHIVLSKDGVPQKHGARWFSLQRVFLLSLVLGILGFVFSAKGLPDYDSYKGLYRSITGFYWSEWEPFFIYLNCLGKYFQLSYEEFRAVLLFLSLTNFTAALYIFSRKLKEVMSRCQKQNRFLAISVGLIFAFAFVVFFLEFFLIRIRAGLSISMVLLAFSLLWPGESKSGKLKFLVIAILLAFAFRSHMQTASVLVYFLFYPVVLSRLYSNSALARQGYSLKILLFYAALIPAVLVVYVVIKLSLYRGANMFSSLNVVRLIALSVIPLIIAVLGIFSGKFIGLRSMLNTQKSGSKSVLVHRTACQLMTWHYFATFSYISMAFALLFFYVTGVVGQSGEAIVRLLTLSSPLGVFIVLCTTGFYRFFWLFVLLSNALFFVNAVFLG